MPAVTGRAAGFIATLYFSDSVISTKDAATLASATASQFKVKDVADMGALSKNRNIIDIPVYGEDVASKLPGQADPGTFDFNITFNMDDVLHKSLRDDDGKTPHTFIIKFTQGANATFAAFDGYIAMADAGLPLDDRIQMDISVARDGGVTWVDAA
ncbi:MAG: hypothetical protein ACK4KU_14665 [Acinetobacter sp.]|uniref:hypothetical protein n=1 Tax=Acinetobacter sp. TaxID=472 RepID=UPI00391BAA1B